MKKEIKDQIELENLRHGHRMLEIETEKNMRKETEDIKFDHQMQIQRIRTAEIHRTLQRKGF